MEENVTRNREARIALVLYGGVSLAVYENGITRTFFDFVREQGAFRILNELLDVNARVDVVSGTSAGGINGLMLAAALESGAEFEEAAALWRKKGDFGELLRSTAKADRTESLLDGEGYYHDELVSAFTDLCKSPENAKKPPVIEPGEMDVFITGTDLDGQEQTFVDSLGNHIHDKSYRTVFHLEHRPGRKKLGVVDVKKEEHRKWQPQVLASVARITSTFPGAFPPFAVKQIAPAARPTVADALQKLSYPRSDTDRQFIDGGVLDNKPFGPTLGAIFHRMPVVPVDRRLFFIDPAPTEFEDQEDESSEKKDTSHTPLAVAVAALQKIPAHESIGDDLQMLIEHNSRVKWLRELRRRTFIGAAAASPDDNSSKAGQARLEDSRVPHYNMIRRESLAISLVLDSDEAPSAHDLNISKARESLYTSLNEELAALFGDTPGSMQALNMYDINFHLRRAFHFLYVYMEKLEELASTDDKQAAEYRDAIWAVGRVVKTLKLTRDALLRLRTKLIEDWEQAAAQDQPAVADILAIFGGFLAAESDHWSRLRKVLPDASIAIREEVRGNRDEYKGFLDSNDLNATNSSIKQVLRLSLTDKASPYPEWLTRTMSDVTKPTILVELENTLQMILEEWPCESAGFEEFRILDGHLYPLMFASGIYELDEISFARISPFDAHTGLSEELEGKEKVAGDELAHFSGLLRRDWRSNDILWGRLDSIAELVDSYLDERAFAHIKRRVLSEAEQASGSNSQATGSSQRPALSDVFKEDAIQAHLDPQCPAACAEALSAAWRTYADGCRDDGMDLDNGAGKEELKRLLILTMQLDAFHQEYPRVIEDLHYQEIVWGLQKGERGNTSQSNSETIERDAVATAHARELMSQDTERLDQKASTGDILADDKRWQDFKKAKIGAQDIVGKNGKIPHTIVWEYLSQATMLIWCMVRNSLKGNCSKLWARTWIVLYRLPNFIHVIALLLRKQSHFAVVYIVTIEVVLATLFIWNLVHLDFRHLAATGLALFAFTVIVCQCTPKISKLKIHLLLFGGFLLVTLTYLIVLVLLNDESTVGLITTWRDELWQYIKGLV